MAVSATTAAEARPAKAAHVNMMTDTVIANMPEEGLRSIMRGLLGGNQQITSNFHLLAANYLLNIPSPANSELFEKTSASPKPTAALKSLQSRYRCLMGCGYAFQSVDLLSDVLRKVQSLVWDENTIEGQDFMDFLAVIDGDIVQAATAVQKKLLTSSGLRPMNDLELKAVSGLKRALNDCKQITTARRQDFAFERGSSCLEKLFGSSEAELASQSQMPVHISAGFVSSNSALETVKLGTVDVPRMFMGLWQFSSPAWGTASRSKINNHFRKHVDAGLIAYDMADHYGDAEVTFGQFRSSQPDADKIYCATKWAVFDPIKISPEAVDANISERLTAINASSVELLQFHWQDYNDHQYVEAAKLIDENPNVQSLGLCNFDTQRMDEIVDSGVNVVSNQVQVSLSSAYANQKLMLTFLTFSLIDLRPTFKMAYSCQKHNVKLLTYGSLCGGFLADKWLGQPAPNLFDKQMTPSHRKYFEMITIWGGWALFQELLSILSVIGKKYNASVSSVAIRWVLDHDYVGAVIIGARMGISEHIEENLTVFSFKLDNEDKGEIQAVLDRCRAQDVFKAMGDCGAEYRQ